MIFNNLTPRQEQVLKELVTRTPYTDIMVKLNLTLGGVRYHANEIFNRTGSYSRVDLMAMYFSESDEHEYKQPDYFESLSETDKGVFSLAIKGFKIPATASVMGICDTKVRQSRTRVFKLSGEPTTLDLICSVYGVGNKGGDV